MVNHAGYGFSHCTEIQPRRCLLSTLKGRSETFFLLWGEPPLVERLMCMAHDNDNHFIIIHLNDDCHIPLACPLWRQHARDDALSWPDRYVSRMADYNELCRRRVLKS